MSDTSNRDHESMISNPSKWPCWPFLPVKRPKNTVGGFPQLGIVLDSKEEATTVTVYLVCMYELIPGRGVSGTLAKKIEYNSVAEFLSDGWVVD